MTSQSPLTASRNLQICAHSKFKLHVNTFSKSFKMRYIYWNSNKHLLRYGNPGRHFFGNPENQISEFEFFSHTDKKSGFIFIFSVHVQFRISKIAINVATLKNACPALIRICPKTECFATFFFKSTFIRNLTFTIWKWYRSSTSWSWLMRIRLS